MGDATSKIHPAESNPAGYCRGCGYQLRGLTTPRCPECGRGFDPGDPRTFRRRPMRHWFYHVKRAALLLTSIAVILAAVWSWFFWGWYSEQQTLQKMKAASGNPTTIKYAPIITPWPKEHLGGAGFVMDRVTRMSFNGWAHLSDLTPLAEFTHLTYLDFMNKSITDITPLAKLKKLQMLYLDGASISDISPLAGLTQLQTLDLRYTHVTDISPIAGLTKLDGLSLCNTPITDITPLAGLTHLRSLLLSDTPIVNLKPLAGLTQLQSLYVFGTPVTDVTPIVGLKSLRTLSLPKETFTEAQVVELRRAMPQCAIDRR